jgi:hypothetical protein
MDDEKNRNGRQENKMDDEFLEIIGKNAIGKFWNCLYSCSMTEKELKLRTKNFAVDVPNFVDDFPVEARELTAIFTSASKTAKQNRDNRISQFPNSKIQN